MSKNEMIPPNNKKLALAGMLQRGLKSVCNKANSIYSQSN